MVYAESARPGCETAYKYIVTRFIWSEFGFSAARVYSIQRARGSVCFSIRGCPSGLHASNPRVALTVYPYRMTCTIYHYYYHYYYSYYYCYSWVDLFVRRGLDRSASIRGGPVHLQSDCSSTVARGPRTCYHTITIPLSRRLRSNRSGREPITTTT